MKGNKAFLILLIEVFFIGLTISNECFAEFKISEKGITVPSCTTVGEIQCPKGFKPSCPKQYKASCVFVGNKQHPACLADSADNTFFNYHLDKISCQKN